MPRCSFTWRRDPGRRKGPGRRSGTGCPGCRGRWSVGSRAGAAGSAAQGHGDPHPPALPAGQFHRQSDRPVRPRLPPPSIRRRRVRPAPQEPLGGWRPRATRPETAMPSDATEPGGSRPSVRAAVFAGSDPMAPPSSGTLPCAGASSRDDARSYVDFPQALGTTMTVKEDRAPQPSDPRRPSAGWGGVSCDGPQPTGRPRTPVVRSTCRCCRSCGASPGSGDVVSARSAGTGGGRPSRTASSRRPPRSPPTDRARTPKPAARPGSRDPARAYAGTGHPAESPDRALPPRPGQGLVRGQGAGAVTAGGPGRPTQRAQPVQGRALPLGV